MPDIHRDRLADAAVISKRARERMRSLRKRVSEGRPVTGADGTVRTEVLAELTEGMSGVQTALDYVAHEIRSRLDSGASGDLYFPVAQLTQSPEEFAAALDATLPGISRRFPKIANEIIALQRFGRPDFGWLSKLRGMHNPSKHEGLLHVQEVRFAGTVSAPGYVTQDVNSKFLNFADLGDPVRFTERAAAESLKFVRRVQRLLATANQ